MRRTIITAIRLILLAAVFVLSGQAAVHAKTVGIIMTGDIPYYHAIHKEFLKEMSSYFSEHNIEVVIQTPLPNPMAWTNAARKLKALGADVVVAYGLPATLATMKEVGNIPVVFAAVYSPETMDIGGKGATGISSTVTVLPMLRKLQSISSFKKVGVIFNKTEKDSILQAREIKKFETKMGFKTILLNISDGLDGEKIASCDALVLTACSAGMCEPYLPEMVKISRKNKVPTVALISGAESMVVLTLAPAAAEQGQKAAEILRKVLGGESCANIPVENPQNIEFIVNLKEAREMGIEIPAEILDAATLVKE